MKAANKTLTWVILVSAIAGAAMTVYLLRHRSPIVLRGAVLRQDSDPSKQSPVADVDITAIEGMGIGKAKSDPSGFFTITLPRGLRRRQPIVLQFRHEDYQPLNLTDAIGDKLYLARMVPVIQNTDYVAHGPEVAVANARVRYTVKATAEANVGSSVRTFQVENKGNQPCAKSLVCSPDRKWKAAIASMALDAGQGNEFRNARVSCIAGPCPFTKIDLEELAQDGRRFRVSVRDWSDSATFLLEAEVVHPMVSDTVHNTYPVIFGRTLNFTMPVSAEGPSIEADVDGEAIVFPLGPNPSLRWADCHIGIDKDKSRNYRCELKSGYQFRTQSAK
jgi:hypothetical protein